MNERERVIQIIPVTSPLYAVWADFDKRGDVFLDKVWAFGVFELISDNDLFPDRPYTVVKIMTLDDGELCEQRGPQFLGTSEENCLDNVKKSFARQIERFWEKHDSKETLKNAQQ
jgi:hypothetical protein